MTSSFKWLLHVYRNNWQHKGEFPDFCFCPEYKEGIYEPDCMFQTNNEENNSPGMAFTKNLVDRFPMLVPAVYSAYVKANREFPDSCSLKNMCVKFGL